MRMDSDDNTQIQTQDDPNCFLCGAPGEKKYTRLEDRLFDVSGKWDLNQCSNPECRLIWLNPRPIEQDIGKLYKNYITHDADRILKNQGKNFLYPFFLSLIRGAITLSLERTFREYFYLNNIKPGRLLEVGCGDGRNLAHLKKYGWDVVGQEIDPLAAQVAKKKCNCEVHIGQLKEIAFSDNTFDVIITNHVLEHLNHPEAVFRECYRILKPDGKFISITPNSDSLGHKFFNKNWVGLDVPRHLNVFSKPSLERLSIKTGFKKHRCWSTAVNAALLNRISFDIQSNVRDPLRNPGLFSGIKALIFKLFAFLYLLKQKNSGEECVLYLEK